MPSMTGCVAAVAYLMKSDVRTGAATFRRNIKHIRGWLEEQSASATEYAACLCIAQSHLVTGVLTCPLFLHVFATGALGKK